MFQTESLLTKPAWKLSRKDYEALVQEHWERIRDLHFGSGGTPYWVDRATRYGVDPKKGLASIHDFLNHEIGFCDENELKEKPFEYFMPASILKTKKHSVGIYTSSGSTGKKKNAPWSSHAFDHNSRFLSHILDAYEVPGDSNFLIIGPSFPAPFQVIMERLAKGRNGFIYFAPIEMREIKKYLASLDLSKFASKELVNDPLFRARLAPALEYQLDILQKERVAVLGTTFFLLPLFAESKGFENVKLIYCGGMEIPADEYRYWKKQLEKADKKIVTSYGHYIFGLTFDPPDQELTYYPPSPYSLLYVVKEDDPRVSVDHGERGRVRFLRMSEAFLWCQVERDYAERVAPRNEFKWDGVRNISTRYE